MVELLAVARTSALLPPAREATRSCEPWKSKVTSRPGLSFSTVFSISSKAPWREAAARTVTLPVAFSAPAEAPGEAAPEAAPVELLLAEPPQAASERAESKLTAAIAARRVIPMCSPYRCRGGRVQAPWEGVTSLIPWLPVPWVRTGVQPREARAVEVAPSRER